MRTFVVLLLFGSCFSSQAQDKNSIEVGASLFGMRQLQELPSNFKQNYLIVPKGLVVHFVGKKLKTVVELNYYRQHNDVGGVLCLDCHGGYGKLRGIETKIGVFKNYALGQFNISPGLSTYLLSSKVMGAYAGGIDWTYRYAEYRTNHIGINPSLSFGFDGFKSIRLSAETGVFIGKLYGNNVDPRYSNERFFAPVQSISLRYKLK